MHRWPTRLQVWAECLKANEVWMEDRRLMLDLMG